MTRGTAKQLNIFLRAISEAPKSLLLLDYDGTLAGFRVDRFKARPWSGVTPLLQQIQSQGRTQIVVITGRPPEEIPPLLGLDPAPEVWGLHGAKRLYADGHSEMETQPPGVKQALQMLRRLLKENPIGGLFEDKPNAAVMHWRGYSPSEARAIAQRSQALFEPLAKLEGLRMLRFESGLELRAGRDKGGAVREIVREAGEGLPVTFLGDDVTDEAGFEAVNGAKAPHLSVLVRRVKRETAADIWLKPPQELKEFLQRWIDAQS